MRSDTEGIGFAPGRFFAGRLAGICLAAVMLLGALYAWDGRNSMNPDGISYLDVAGGMAHGNWAQAVNRYWSPLYPSFIAGALALHPSSYWEPTAIHLVNFLIFLLALWCFHYFWAPLVARDPVWMSLGYAVFAWSALQLITVSVVTPDLLVAALVYLALALLHREDSRRTVGMAALGGAALGLGYLAKGILFPLAFVLCGLVIALRGWTRQIAVTLVVFAVVSGVWIALLFRTSGQLTFSDAGKITYVMYVNRTPETFFPTGATIGPDIPAHPLQRVYTQPEVFSSPYPFMVTCPAWYDPAYWYQGTKMHVQPRAEWDEIKNAARVYVSLLLSLVVLPAGIVAFWVMGYPWRPGNWLMALWPAAALGAYALIHVEFRLVAPFVALLWLWAYLGYRRSAEGGAQTAILVVAIALLAAVAAPAPQMMYHAVEDLRAHRIASADWQVATALQGEGLQTGATIAYVGDACGTYFTRLAHLTVPIWIPSSDTEKFWGLDAAGKQSVFAAMAHSGAQAVVAPDVPPSERSAWRRLGETDEYFHSLDTAR